MLLMERVVKVTFQDKVQPIECAFHGCLENVDGTENTLFTWGVLCQFERLPGGVIAERKNQALCWKLLYLTERSGTKAPGAAMLKKSTIVGNDPECLQIEKCGFSWHRQALCEKGECHCLVVGTHVYIVPSVRLVSPGKWSPAKVVRARCKMVKFWFCQH